MPAMATPNNRTGISDPGYNMREVASLTAAILTMRSALAPERALLVGISGIDGSGKGFVTAQLAERLRALNWNVAAVSADDWLNLPDVCINRDDPAEHFYRQALRFDEMFERLVLPLKQSRGVDLVADCGDAKATVHRKHRYRFQNIDIILLEDFSVQTRVSTSVRSDGLDRLLVRDRAPAGHRAMPGRTAVGGNKESFRNHLFPSATDSSRARSSPRSGGHCFP
jgi:hypothetical protein